MSPKIQQLLSLLDDEQALAAYLDENGYDDYTFSQYEPKQDSIVRGLAGNAAALAFRLRDEAREGESEAWEESLVFVSSHWNMPSLVREWNGIELEHNIYSCGPSVWIIAALIAKALKEQG